MIMTSHSHLNQQPAARLPWGTLVALGVTALLRPATRIVEHLSGADWGRAVPLSLTVIITVLWVLVLGLRRDRLRPGQVLASGVVVGLVYAVLATLLSAVVSPIVDGRLDGPLARPAALPSMVIVNAVWGLVAGALALGLRSFRGPRTER
jgi:hypothetical protein